MAILRYLPLVSMQAVKARLRGAEASDGADLWGSGLLVGRVISVLVMLVVVVLRSVIKWFSC